MNTPRILVTASTKPRNVEPVSPIKISAGLKFLGRKPKQAPASAAVKPTAVVLPVIMQTTIRLIAAMEVTPAARPSKPSIRFTAFVTPTIQTSVIGMLNFCKYAVTGQITT